MLPKCVGVDDDWLTLEPLEVSSGTVSWPNDVDLARISALNTVLYVSWRVPIRASEPKDRKSLQ